MQEEYVKRIEAMLNGMSLREKIGQMAQYSIGKIDRSSDDSIRTFIGKYPVGSIFSGADVANRWGGDDAEDKVAKINRFSRIPLAVSGDLESGTKALQLPEPLALAAVHDPQTAYEYGRWIGIAGRAAGYSWSFSPESDIAFNWMSPINNHRGMGDDPELIAELAANIVRGMQQCGISACCKHFPGDGTDFRDQHIGYSANRMSRSRWFDTYGRVYRRTIAEGLHSIMVGHIALPFQDPSGTCPLPGTLSKKIVTDLLRDELGFDGVIVSDALVMGGYSRVQPYEWRMVESIKAGIDVMLWPGFDFIDIVERAVEQGEITEKRIDESVRRILGMKFKEGVLGEPVPVPESSLADGEKFAVEVAERGTALVRNLDGVLPFKSPRRMLAWFAVEKPDDVEKDYSTLISGLRSRCDELVVKSNGNCLELLAMEDAGERFDAVVFFFDVKIKITEPCRPHGSQAECIWTLANTAKHRPVVVGLNSPYLLMENPTFRTLVNAHSGGKAVMETLPKLLFGEVPFSAKSPVTFPELLGVDEAL
ncbi:MAG: glycoside hydrolase family 3 protein [Victivallaceae bacterium]|nr:glycoside hydrolase family 3 protein [Victivallaceae bacterium]